MGLATAWALGKRGVRCALLDALPRRTERNASNDESKVFRLAYEDKAHYSALALQALAGWDALEQAARRPLLHRTGLLMLGRDRGSFALRSHATLAAMGRTPLRLDAAEVARAHPAFAGGGFEHAVVDRDGGLLDPAAVLESLEAEAMARGARILRGAPVRRLEQDGPQQVCVLDAGRVRARAVVVAAGHRAPFLLPELAPVLACTRQPEFLFDAPGAAWEAPALPVWAAFEDGFYGFPRWRGAVKVADHRKGPLQPWEPDFAAPTPQEEATVRSWLREAMPALAGAPLARSRTCHYDNTPDDDFLLGPHPARDGVVLAAGFSGHGFKFAPAVGDLLAALALGEAPAIPPACAPGRLLA
jgi:sarcosine oxidase